MTGIRIVTDSAADLAADLVAQLKITVVPLAVLFGTTVYPDGQLSVDEFWDKVRRGPHHPGTSQPSLGAFDEAFARLVEAGHQVLCLTVTGKHSGTFSTAQAAARRFGDMVRVIDSRSLSLGQGFQVMAAARAAMQGLGLNEVSALVERMRERMRLFILLDAIEHLRRGGRAARLIPLLGRVTKALNIKPILETVDGHLGLHRLVRSYERGLVYLRREIGQLRPLEHLAVVHTRNPDVADRLAGALSEQVGMPRQEIIVTETGPLLSVHAGSRVIGVAAVPREQ